ncbi:MAG: hypothetical protein ACFFB3_11720 [Candidatus Hodarchaeota archaeon]
MTSESKDELSSSEDNPRENNPRIPAEVPEAPALTGNSPTETENRHSAPVKIPTTGEEMTGLPNQTPAQPASSSAKETSREELSKSITEQELTDVIVWAVRQLAPVEACLDRYSILDLVGNWLLEQQSNLLWLLARPPQQVLTELEAIQRRKAENLRKYWGQRRQEEGARLTASLADQEGNDNA